MEAFVKRSILIACSLAGAALAIAGAACLAVSSHTVEESDGFHVMVGSHRLSLPDSGMLGDGNTYTAEWSILGLFCLGAATLSALLPWFPNAAARGILCALLMFAVAAIVLFAHNLSVL
jgi:hypothetical protein